MKPIYIYALSLMVLSASCKKSWLEIVPQGSQVAKTVADFDMVMNDPGLYNYDNSGGLADAMLMGDEVAAEGEYFVNYGPNDLRERFFQWRDSIYTLPTLDAKQLNRHLTQLYQHNVLISEIMNAEGGSEQQKKALRAEAMATRAWSYFMMANYFCKPYNPATAASDPGFPIITDPDVTVNNYPRGTVQQTYDFIINDLATALRDIPMKQSFVTRMSKPAVEALLGKVYLFMGRYNDALPLLTDALAHVNANNQSFLYNYNQTLAPGGSFLPIDPLSIGPVNGPGNNRADTRESVLFKVYYAGSYNGNHTGNDGLVLTEHAMNLYDPSDLRRYLYSANHSNNTPNAAGRWRKYGVTWSRWGMQLPELYLLCAEAKARTNNLSGAVADLETLRNNRMPDGTVPAATAASQNLLIRFIMDERIREFAMEGYRWFDMRRLSVDPLFAGTQYTHTIYREGGSNEVFTLQQPNRLTLLFPRVFTDGNPGFQNNP